MKSKMNRIAFAALFFAAAPVSAFAATCVEEANGARLSIEAAVTRLKVCEHDAQMYQYPGSKRE